MKLAVDHINRPRAGEAVSGDLVVVREDQGRQLLCVIDALGHGPKAAAAAEAAGELLRTASLVASIEELVWRLHDGLRGTRGAAALICLVDGDDLQGVSVGNVSLRSTSRRLSVLQTPGVLGGAAIRRLRIFRGRLEPGERLVAHTDGVSGRFNLEETAGTTPRQACQAILEEYGRAEDDATVLVADAQS